MGGVAYPLWGVTLVRTWLMAGGGGKAKVLLLMKPLEVQYYFAPKGSEVMTCRVCR